MDIQTAIDGLEKEREEIKRQINSLNEILMQISETLPDVPRCHREWSNHPATRHLNDVRKNKSRESTRLWKAIKDLKAIIK